MENGERNRGNVFSLFLHEGMITVESMDGDDMCGKMKRKGG